MPNTDVVWVDVLPSLKNFGARLRSGTDKEASGAGRSAGDAYGKSFEDAAATKVQQASKKMSDAMRGVQDAAGRVALAEQKLTETRENSRVKASQVLAAEEALARARRAETAANEALNASARRVREAQDAQARSSIQLADGTERAGKGLLALRLENDALDRSSAKLTGVLGTLGKVGALAFASLGSQAVVGGLVAVTGAAAGAAGAIGLVPAAAFAVAAPVAAAKLGLVGMADAFKAIGKEDPKKTAEALAKLAPSARAFAVEVQTLKPAFDGMRLEVQQQLFEGLNTRLGSLADVYLPLAETRLRRFSALLGLAAIQVAEFFLRPSASNDIVTMLENSEVAFRQVASSAAPVVSILTDIGVVGSSFLPRLSGGLADAARQAAAFVSNARETGRLQEWISGGLSVLGQLGQLLGNVGSIIYSVFSAGAVVGGGFIETMRVATGEVARFLNSPVGQSMLASFFSAVGTAVSALAPLLGLVGQIMLGVVAPALSALAVQLAPVAQVLLTALLRALQQIAPVMPAVGQAMGALAMAMLPLIPIVAQLAVTLLPPLARVLEFMAPVIPPLVIGVMALMGAMSVLSSVVTAVVAITTAWKNVQLVASAATAAWTAIQAALNVTFLGFPLVWVLAAFAAVVAAIVLLYRNSETFRDVVQTVWAAVQTAISWAWENVIKPVWSAMVAGFQALATEIGRYWQDVLRPALTAVGDVIVWLWENVARPYFGFVLAAWQAVATGIGFAWTNILQPTWNAVAAAGMWLWNEVLAPAFRGIQAAWDALVTAARWAWDYILNPVWEAIKAAAQVLLGVLIIAVFGPIVLAWEALAYAFDRTWNLVIRPMWNALQAAALFMWENVLRPLWDVMRVTWDVLAAVWRQVYESVILPMWLALQAAARVLWEQWLRPIWDEMRRGWEALAGGFRYIYDVIIQPLWNTVQDAAARLRDIVGAAWSALGVIAGNVWDNVRRTFVTGVNNVIDLINAFLGVVNTVAGKVGISLNLRVDRLPSIAPPPPNGGGTGGAGGSNIRLAAGGMVPGYSPNDRADNIPAWLTAREWVHPVDSVDYYGREIMARIQHKQIPREQLQYLATGGEIFDLVRGAFPRAKLNSSYRPGDPGFHGRNQAADLGEAGFAGGAGRPYIAAMKQWFVDNYGRANEIIYNGIGNNRPNIKNGAAFPYSAGVQAQHKNHLHVAIAGALAAARGGPGGAPTGGGGGAGGVVREFLGDVAQKLADPLKGAVTRLTGTGDLMRVVGGAANKAIQAVVDAIRTKDDAMAAAAGPSGPLPPGSGVERWRPTVQDALRRLGLPLNLDATTLRRMQQESGGNPRAINNWDVNAKRGTPSKGLMQVIDPTFAAFRDRGLPNDIWNPLSNIVASMRYALNRYGSLPAAYNRAGGYAAGGEVLPVFHDGGHTRRWKQEGLARLAPDERVFSPAQDDYWRRFVDSVSGVGGPAMDGGTRKLADKIEVHANTEDQGRDIVEKLWHKVRVADRGGVYTFTS